VSTQRWTRPEIEFLEVIAGDLPLREVAHRLQMAAIQHGWPRRSVVAVQQRMRRTGHAGRVRTGDWLTTGGVAEVLGCPPDRVRSWLRHRTTGELLAPKWRGGCRYVSRASLRRLARERPHVLGGYPVDRLHALLEDRELAEQIAQQYPRQAWDWRIRCVETGQVWATAAHAARDLHVDHSTIRLAMRERRAVTTLGLRFEAA
jgi:hypothetical protein